MADQQDQLSSGGSAEKVSASADTSKSKGKSSSSSGYRKRHSNSTVQTTLEEKRRRQNISDPQPQHSYKQQRPVEVFKGENRPRNERRNNTAGVECLLGKGNLT